MSGAPFYVSQSKTSDWQLCRRKYHLRWQEHLRPRAPARALKFGSVTHELLDADAHGINMMTKLKDITTRDAALLAHAPEEYGALIVDIGYVMRAYKQFWSSSPLHFKRVKRGRVTLKAIELPFEIELTQDIVAKGKLDGLVTEKKSDWILEHKTHQSFPNADHRWRNTQSAVYIRIVEMLGWAKPAGMLWDYVRSKPPSRPRLLASGKLSEAECDSLPEVITDTANQYIQSGHHQVRLQITGAVANLVRTQRDNLHTWFQRVYTPVQPAVVKSLFADFVDTAREIFDYYSRTTVPPRKSIGLHCSWCPFEAICRAELQGNDIDLVRETQFVVDDSEYQTRTVE